jgi:YggT family protein
VNDQVALVFTTFLYILIALVVARALISWFPTRPDNPFVRVIHQLTEPMLEPIRRFMPKTGMIDLSAMVLIVLLYVMIAVVNRAADA